MLISPQISTTASHLSASALKPSTLNDCLRWRALHQAERHAYTFLHDGEQEAGRLTYAELDFQARTIGSLLQSISAAGERALLLYPPGLEFVAAFFGCLYAGTIAIPAPPPRLHKTSTRLSSIIVDAQPSVVLTTSALAHGIESYLAMSEESESLKCVVTDNLPAELASQWQEPVADRHALAFLQYTSGSTTTPKGVMVSHGNILQNSEDLDRGWAHTDESTIVTWLPHFHDMGLIYGVIHGVFRGIPSYLMPPAYFLQRPFRWLQAISHYGATHTAAPNFAYDLCVRKITPEMRDTLDLKSWQVAVNGAEPVRQQTLVRFSEYFAPSGFRASTFCPGYGLAEATLKVAASRNGEPLTYFNADAAALERHRVVSADPDQDNSRVLVSCGSAMMDTKVVIVAPETLVECEPGIVGEIWVSGQSIAQGYWQRPEDSEATFRARLADTGEGPFLRTGDLGFLDNGEVYITGRLKDLIIIGGHNHYPQDIELTVEESHPAFRRGCSASFGVTLEGEERLVVVAEVDPRYRQTLAPQPGAAEEASPEEARLSAIAEEEIIRTAKRKVAEQHELPLYDVLLLKAGTIPKTSSGKIQRHASKDGYLNRALASWDA
jgi:acyl-CoA synthetase (AMP-forming)/AMP-acid ligase II